MTCIPVKLPSELCSELHVTSYRLPHLGHLRSLCRPSSVGAIEPVGITKASATKPRKSSARTTAIATDSTVSRQPPSGGADLSGSVCFLRSFVGLDFVITRISKHQAPKHK